MLGSLQLAEVALVVAEPRVLFPDRCQMLHHSVDGTAVFLLQPLDGDEALHYFVEASRIVTHGVAQSGQLAGDVLQSIDDFLQLARCLAERGDLARERLQEMDGPAELRQRGGLVFLQELKRSGCRLDQLPGVRQDALLVPKRLLFRRVELCRGDFLDLVSQEVESERAIALGVGELFELGCRIAPCAVG